MIYGGNTVPYPLRMAWQGRTPQLPCSCWTLLPGGCGLGSGVVPETKSCAITGWVLGAQHQSFETLTACGRHSALPRECPRQHNSSAGIREHWCKFLEADPQWHWPGELPRALEHLCKSAEIKDLITLTRQCCHHLQPPAEERGTAPYSSPVWVIVCCCWAGAGLKILTWRYCYSVPPRSDLGRKSEQWASREFSPTRSAREQELMSSKQREDVCKLREHWEMF